MALAARGEVDLVRAAISQPGRYYDDHRTIVLRAGMLLAEERWHLWHELVHADRRDRTFHTDAAVERLVDRTAAERAMPWSSVEWAWTDAADMSEMAELLKMPEAAVHFRMKYLDPEQKALLRIQ